MSGHYTGHGVSGEPNPLCLKCGREPVGECPVPNAYERRRREPSTAPCPAEIVTIDLSKDENGLLGFEALRQLRSIYHSLNHRDLGVIHSSPDSPIIRLAAGTRAEHFAEYLATHEDKQGLHYQLQAAHYETYLKPKEISE